MFNQAIASKSNDDAMEAKSRGQGSRSSSSSDTVLHIKSAGDYEAYNMRQVSTVTRRVRQVLTILLMTGVIPGGSRMSITR